MPARTSPTASAGEATESATAHGATLTGWWQPRAAAMERGLARWPRGIFLVVAAGSALALAGAFFCPRLFILLAEPDPLTFQWNRGLNFLGQCADPFAPTDEAALRWRILPPLVAHVLHLRGLQPLVLAWLGVGALGLATAAWGERLLQSRVSAFALVILVATTSAVLVPLHWVGIHDAWVWLGLLAVVLSPHRGAVALAGLLCPWIDERFIIGLPLAIWARAGIGGSNPRDFWRELFSAGLWVLPYALVRGFFSLRVGDPGSAVFLQNALADLRVTLQWAPLGWWMGLRAAWVFNAVALLYAVRERRVGLEVLIAGATIALSTFLAHDLSRSIAILLPWVVLGIARLHRDRPATAQLALVCAALANLALPAAHVVFKTVDIMSPLPLELVRVLN